MSNMKIAGELLEEHETNFCSVIMQQVVDGKRERYESQQFELPPASELPMTRGEMIAKLPIKIENVSIDAIPLLTTQLLIKIDGKFYVNKPKRLLSDREVNPAGCIIVGQLNFA